jgi:mRNA interferase RelE/StbE
MPWRRVKRSREVSNQRFEVRFDIDALTEYQRLDHALVTMVDKALARLEERADEIGMPLKNKYATKLHGCKEIKLRDAGLRIAFRVTDHTVEVLRVVYILTIERRDRDWVCRVADKQLRHFKSGGNLPEFLFRSPRWEARRRSARVSRKETPENNAGKPRGARTPAAW